METRNRLIADGRGEEDKGGKKGKQLVKNMHE